MTKETKIGLLVGLTFIILFAIILSKKGPGNTKTPNFTSVDSLAMDTASPSGGIKPFGGDGNVPVESKLPSPVQNEPAATPTVTFLEEQVGQAIPEEGEPLRPLPEALLNNLNMPMMESQIAGAGDEADPEDAAVDPLTESVVATLNGNSNASPGLSSSSPLLLRNDASPANSAPMGAVPNSGTPTLAQNHPLIGINPSPAGNAPALTPDRTRTPAKPMTIVAVHEVQPGESLGKIAAKHYGRATPARVEAIFNANRDQLESVDAVKTKTKLNIPLLEGEYAGMFEPVSRLSPPPVAAAGGDAAARNPAVAARNTGAAGQRRDDTIRIPIPVDERVATSSAVPTVDSGRIATSPQPGNTRDVARAQPIVPSVQFSWYEVREKDTLSKIARSQLGSEAKYREIYKLNQDIIPDVHKLKPGMKIRIPSKSVPAQSSSLARESLAGDPSFEQ